MIRRPPRSTLFPTRRSSDLASALLSRMAATVVALESDPELAARADATLRDLGVDNVVLVQGDRKSTRLNSSHANISYAVFCLKKKKKRKEVTLVQDVL